MELQLDMITKSFGEKKVLEGISFTASSGAALGLLGRNGAGKTTTIRIIMGVFPPDAGQILVDGKPIHDGDVNFGYLPEERGLYPKQKIIDQMIYIGRLRGLTRQAAKKNAEYWLGRLDMSAHRNDLLRTLSKGNQQKIQLGVCLLHNPDVIILDEPFSGLDPVNAQLLKDVVTELAAAGKTVIFSSHQMSYVEEFCDSIAMLDKGRIALEGNLRAIKRSYERNKILVSLDGGDAAGRLAAMRADGALDGFVAGLEKPAKAADTADEVIVELAAPSDKDKLLAAILAAGASLETFRVMEPSLEQIFVERVGESE